MAWEKIRFIRSCCNSARICPRIIRFNRNDSRQRLSCLESPHLRGDLRGFPLFTILKRRHFLPAVARPLIRGNFSSPLLSSSNKTSIITLSMEYKRENGKVIFLYQIFLSAAPRLHRNENALRNLSREKRAMYRTIGLWQVVTRTITRQYLTRWGKLARTDWLSYSEFE